MDEYNNHYITVDRQLRITDGWSDGPHPERDTSDAILLTDKGGYQFRLEWGGEENPPLYDEYGVPLYKWDGIAPLRRTVAEIEADRAEIPVVEPEPTAEDILNALLGV